MVSIQYECCGVFDHTDFEEATQWNNTRIFGANIPRMMATPLAWCASVGDFPDITLIDDECAFEPLSEESNNYMTVRVTPSYAN